MEFATYRCNELLRPEFAPFEGGNIRNAARFVGRGQTPSNDRNGPRLDLRMSDQPKMKNPQKKNTNS